MMNLLCGHCGRSFSVEDEAGGGRVPCPHCEAEVVVPSFDEEPGEAVAARADRGETEEFLTKARLALKKKLLVVCTACDERLTVQQRLAGQVVRCPACGESLRIPDAAASDLPQAGAPTRDSEEELLAEAPASEGPELDVLAAAADGPEDRPARAKAPPLVAEARVIEEISQAIAAYPARREGSDRVRWLWAAVFGVVLAAALAVGTYALLGGPATTAPPPDGDRADIDGPVATPTGDVPDPGPPVSPPPQTRPTRTRPVRPPIVAPPKIRIRNARQALLAGPGDVPAPLGHAWLLVEAKVSAGTEPLDFETSRVILDFIRHQIPAEGLPAAKGAPSHLPARPARVKIAAGESRQVTFVFLAPTEMRLASVRIPGAETELPSVAPLSPDPPMAALGEWVEHRRRLPLGPSDDLTERVRNSPDLRLLIRKGDKGPRAILRPTDLSGRLRPVEGDGWALESRHVRPNPLLRVHGDRLVLYLGDQPYEQVVFRRK
jgi:DNA-directed RNA polymerase subunit RPC12/RpoP/predicted RNA-binding Zn-ribbon protein involved in translation (DUF1610 family)